MISLDTPEDYKKLLPKGLPECFNSAIFAKAIGIPRSEASYVINPLTWLGVLRQIGKVSGARIYEVVQ